MNLPCLLSLVSRRRRSVELLRRRASHRIAMMATMCAAMLLPGAASAQTAHFNTQSVAVSGLFTASSVAVDASGALYVADTGLASVIKYVPDSSGGYIPNGSIGTPAFPVAVAVAPAGDVFVLDQNVSVVHRYVPNGSGGYTQQADLANGAGSMGGALAVDNNGTLFIADTINNSILRSLPDGAGGYGVAVTVISDHGPIGLAVDSAGTVYSAAQTNWAVHRFIPNGSGSYTLSTTDVINGFLPGGVAVDRAGTVYASRNDVLAVNQFIPNDSGGYTNLGNIASSLDAPKGLAADSSGNAYVANGFNVLKIATDGMVFPSTNITASVTRTLTFTFDTPGSIVAPLVLTSGSPSLDFVDAGTGTCTTNGASHTYAVNDTCTVDVTFAPKLPGQRRGAVQLTNAHGAVAATANLSGLGVGPHAVFLPGSTTTLNTASTSLSFPFQTALDGAGNFYIANSGTNQVTRVPVGGGTGVTYAGASGGEMTGIAIDGAGNLFAADRRNNEILVYPSGSSSFNVLTVSGLTTALNTPLGLAYDGKGVLYIADSQNSRIVEVQLNTASLSTSTPTGTGSVLATPGISLSGVTITAVAVDATGNVYLSDKWNNRVIKVTPQGVASAVSTGSVSLYQPQGLATDAAGNLYIANAGQSIVEVLALGGAASSTVSGMNPEPTTLTVDPSGYLLIADYENNRVLRTDVTAAGNTQTFPTTLVGSTSAAQTITVQNSGNADLSLLVPFTGNNPSISADFSLSSTGSTACPLLTNSASGPATLVSGGICTLPISFAPTAAGNISGSLVLTDNQLNASPSATQTITLNGTALAPLTATTQISSVTLSYAAAVTAFTPVTGSGGTTPYSYSISPSLPAGLTFNTGTGAISGTPTQTLAATTYTVTITDNTSATASSTFSLTVGGGTATLSFAAIGTKTYGDAPFTVSASSASTGAITYSVLSGPATVSGSTVTLTGAGSVTLQASQAADSNYTTATATTTFTVNKVNPLLSFSAGTTLTWAGSPLTDTALSNSTGAFTLAITSGPATVSGPVVTLTGAGTVHLTVQQAADSNYNSYSGSATITVLSGTATLAFTPIAAKTYGDAPFAVSASSSATGAVTYAVVSGPATVSGNVVTLTGAGLVTLQASQAADSNYNAANATTSFNVTAATPTLTLTAIGAKTYGDAPFTVSASSASTGAITYSVLSGPATVSGSTVTLTGSGTVTLQASQAAAGNYATATATTSFVVNQATLVLSFSTIGVRTYGDAPFSVAASSASTGTVTYSVLSGPATVSGSVVTITGAGSVVLLASQAADSNYHSGTTTTTFTVVPAPLTLTAANATRYYGVANSTFTGTVTGAKNNDSFTESFATTATTLSPVGSYAIVPSVTGAALANYTVTAVNGALTITQALAPITLTASSASTNPLQAVTLTASVVSSTSGTPTGSVTFSDNGVNLATIAVSSTGKAVYTGTFAAGNHSLAAIYSGDTNFLPSFTTGTGSSIISTALDFTFTGPAAAQMTTASSVNMQFNLAPSTSGGYPGPVSLALTGLPSGFTASYTPTAVGQSGGAQNVVLTLSAPATLAQNRPASSSTSSWALALLLLPLAGARRLRRSARGLRGALFLLLIAAATAVGLGGLTGCGAGYFGAETASYNLTMTATSGSLQRTAAFTVTVTRQTR